MRSYRTGLLAAAFLCAVTPGSSAPQTPAPKAQPPAPSQPPSPPKPDAAAKALDESIKTKVMDEALKRLDLDRLVSMETTLWQEIDLQGFVFRATGRYLAATGHKVNLSLRVQAGGTEGRYEQVCDGATLWEAGFTGPEELVRRKVQLPKILEALGAPNVSPETRENYFRNQSFAGVTPLLSTLRRKMTFTKQEDNVRWNGHDTTRLTAVWAPEVAQAVPPIERIGVPYPQKCRMYLDAKTYWPYRLEWLGPPSPGAAEAVLYQMEFRDPKLGQPIPPEQFAARPGTGEARDATQLHLDMIKGATNPRPPAGPRR